MPTTQADKRRKPLGALIYRNFRSSASMRLDAQAQSSAIPNAQSELWTPAVNKNRSGRIRNCDISRNNQYNEVADERFFGAEICPMPGYEHGIDCYAPVIISNMFGKCSSVNAYAFEICPSTDQILPKTQFVGSPCSSQTNVRHWLTVWSSMIRKTIKFPCFSSENVILCSKHKIQKWETTPIALLMAGCGQPNYCAIRWRHFRYLVLTVDLCCHFNSWNDAPTHRSITRAYYQLSWLQV